MIDVLRALLGIGTVPAVSMLTSWLKRCEWTPEHKRLLTAAVSFFFAGLMALADDRIDLANLGGSFALILWASRAFYELYFQHTPLNKRLEEGTDDSGPST